MSSTTLACLILSILLTRSINSSSFCWLVALLSNFLTARSYRRPIVNTMLIVKASNSYHYWNKKYYGPHLHEMHTILSNGLQFSVRIVSNRLFPGLFDDQRSTTYYKPCQHLHTEKYCNLRPQAHLLVTTSCYLIISCLSQDLRHRKT